MADEPSIAGRKLELRAFKARRLQRSVFSGRIIYQLSDGCNRDGVAGISGWGAYAPEGGLPEEREAWN